MAGAFAEFALTWVLLATDRGRRPTLARDQRLGLIPAVLSERRGWIPLAVIATVAAELCWAKEQQQQQ
jgi:hypothetical protein